MLQNLITMSPELRKLRIIKKSLRFGVVYVFLPLISGENFFLSKFRKTPIESFVKTFMGFEIHIIESNKVHTPTLLTRRINVGNAGKDAVVEMPFYWSSFADGSIALLKRFAESATDVTSTEKGDKTLLHKDVCQVEYCIAHDEDSVSYSNASRELKPSSEKKRSVLGWFKRKEKDHIEYVDNDIKECDEEVNVALDDVSRGDDRQERDFNKILERYLDKCPQELEPENSDDDEIVTIEQEREMAFQAIQSQIINYVTKYHADPSQLIQTLLKGKIVIGGKKKPSPLVVNNDLKIVLPNYNEVEVKMPAMCRAIYILFLKHHKGIALRNIADYRSDLENIYSMVMPGRSEEKAKEAIENLLDPMSNTLNEYISKIKRCFKLFIVDEALADQYCITGRRGKTYRIALDSSLITLPRAITMK